MSIETIGNIGLFVFFGVWFLLMQAERRFNKLGNKMDEILWETQSQTFGLYEKVTSVKPLRKFSNRTTFLVCSLVIAILLEAIDLAFTENYIKALTSFILLCIVLCVISFSPRFLGVSSALSNTYIMASFISEPIRVIMYASNGHYPRAISSTAFLFLLVGLLVKQNDKDSV